MKDRILGAAILVVLLLPAFFIGGWLMKVVISLVTCGAIYELLKTTNKKTPVIIYILSMVLALMFVNKDSIGCISPEIFSSYTYLMLSAVVLLVPCIFLREKGYGANDALKALGSVLFVGLAFSSISKLYDINKYQVLFVVLIAVTTDVFALFGGMLIGKTPLTKISPKKTVEGSCVGTIICFIVCTTYYVLVLHSYKLGIVLPMVIVLSIAGQIGDLFFSLIKRENNIKDYSHLIPGHGGILDRFDSLIFISLVYSLIINII